MIVIPPINITETNLVSSTVAEPSTGEVEWNAATNYTQGQVVIRTTTHKKYESIAGGVDAGLPENTPTKWLEIGPTNKWAMFDQNRTLQTVDASGNITVEIMPNKRIDTVSVLGLEAKTVQIIMTVGVDVVYDSGVINTNGRTTTTWSQYFFGEFEYIPSVIRQDLPPYSGAKITIIIDNDTLPAKCSGVVIGMKEYIGAVQYNAKSDSLNFSKIERDEFGNSLLIPRRTIPRTQQTLWLEKPRVNNVRKIRRELNAVPALWSGLDDKYDDPYFEAILIYGVYKQFEIDLAQPQVAIINLELEEL